MPVVPLCLLHFSCFSTFLRQRSVRSKLPANSFNELGLFALTTPCAMMRISILFITPLSALVPIAISFTLLSSVSSSKLGLPAFLKVGLATFHLDFQAFTVVLLKLYLTYLDQNFLITDAVPDILYIHVYFFFIVSGTAVLHLTF